MPGEVIAPALVGHAGSEAGERVASFDDEVERLAALVPEGATAHVVGYSLGARLGLALLARHPRRFPSGTLIGVHPGLRDEHERRERRASDEKWCALLETEGVEAFVAAWQEQPLFATQRRLPAAVLEAQRAERLSHSAAGLARSLRVTGLGQMPDLRPELRLVSPRLTVLAGELDAKFAAFAEELARIVPGCVARLGRASGHNLLLEDPDLVTEAISEGISS